MPKLKVEPVELDSITGHGNMLQSGFWGGLKSGFGWRAFAFLYDSAESGTDGQLLVLVRRLPSGHFLAYIPHGPMTGPDVSETKWSLCAMLAEAVRPYLPSNCIFIRFDPPWGITVPALSKELQGYPEDRLCPTGPAARLFKKAQMDIQPPSTVLLGLEMSDDELLAGMKSKTRYNIRLASKKGVEVRTAGKEDLPEWYELYKVTAERDKIALHSYEYYEQIFTFAETSGKGYAPELRLLQAVIDGKVEAGIITAWQGIPGQERRATYLYGASSNDKRNYMPAYALQWEAIRQAAAAGCLSYDFFGIPPVDDAEHPMYGLYRFKTGFGGNILHRPGCWDFPYSKAAYSAYSAAEKARNFYYKKLRKR